MDVVFGPSRRPFNVELYQVSPGTVMENDTFQLSAFPVAHRGPGCYGYVFEERARRPFLADRADVLGVPRGPERGQLVRGDTITVPGGAVVGPDDVLGPVQPGTKLVFVGDAARTDNLVEAARGADALVIEATYLDRESDLAKEFGHLTTRQSAELARDAGVGALILTHLSRRYYEREVLAEAVGIFAPSYVARDFDAFQIGKGGSVKLARSLGRERG